MNKDDKLLIKTLEDTLRVTNKQYADVVDENLNLKADISGLE